MMIDFCTSESERIGAAFATLTPVVVAVGGLIAVVSSRDAGDMSSIGHADYGHDRWTKDGNGCVICEALRRIRDAGLEIL